jgi:hypothetical protein
MAPKAILEKAIAAARLIPQAHDRAETLAAIAEAQIAKGDPAGAQETLRGAMTAAKAIDGPAKRASTLLMIVQAQAKANDIGTAQAAAAMIGEPRSYAEALMTIAGAQTGAGDPAAAADTLAEAAMVAKAIQAPAPRARAYIVSAAAQAKGDRAAGAATLRLAAKVASEIADFPDDVDTLQTIMEAQCEVRDFSGALTTADRLANNFMWMEALTKVATAQAKAGDQSAARSTFRRVLDAAESIDDAERRASALTIVVPAQAEAGDRGWAEATLREALAAVTSITDDHAHFALGLKSIARAQAALGDRSAAAATLARAEAAAKRVAQDSPFREVLFLNIGEAQADIGEWAAAAATFREAAAASTRPPGFVLLNIASMQRAAGDRDGALRTLEEARALADRLKARDTTLTLVAAVQAGASFSDLRYPDHFYRARNAALKSLDLAAPSHATSSQTPLKGDVEAALATAKAIVQPGRRFGALEWIAAALLGDGDYPALRPIPGEILSVANDLDAPVQRTAFHRAYDIVLVEIAAGDVEGALPAARAMQQVGLGSTLLAAAAWVQAETGNVTAARATLVEALTHDSNGNTAKDPILLRLGALALANMGDAAEALAVIDKIEEPRSRAEALLAIAADKRPDFSLLQQ